MPVHCHTLSAATNFEEFGGKACNLARARQLGLPVPRTFVIDRGALRLFLARNGFEVQIQAYLDSAVQGASAELTERYRRLVDAVQLGSIQDELRREIGQVVEKMLTASPYGLAIRSSAMCEDSQRASFAGVFESFVSVMTADEALEKMVSCWCSTWSPKAIRYVAQMELETSIDGMAVMIQEVVPATCSGVIYTADPVSGDPWQFVLQATRGLSIDLMSGSGAGDLFRLEWETGTTKEKEIIDKPAPIFATPSGVRTIGDGTTNERVPSISEEDAVVVAGLAWRLDDAFDMRLDIEWAITSDGPFILQVRPLTALPSFFPAELTKDQRNRAWEPALVVLPLRPDHPPNFLTPLYSHYSESEMWYRYQPHDIILTGIWKCELDLNGYRYGESGPRPTFEDFFDNPRQYEEWLALNEPRYRKRWGNRFAELRCLADSAQTGIRETTQAADLVPVMLDVMDRLWDLNSFGWSGPQALGWMCEAALRQFLEDQSMDVETATLLCSDSDSYTYQVTENEQVLGRSIDEPVVVEAFDHLPLGEIVPHLMSASPHSTFLSDLESFCWRFGKTPQSWLGRPPLWSAGTNDVQIISAIKNARLGRSKDVRVLQAESMRKCHDYRSGIRETLAIVGQGIVERFDRLLEWARYWGQALNDRHGLLSGLLWERELIWHVGTRLQQEGKIEAPIDVLVFTRDDLEKVANTGCAESLTKTYDERRRTYRRNRRLVPPAVVGAPPPDERKSEASDTETETVQSDGERGSYVGRGFGGDSATGRARVITNLLDPEVLDSLGSDDVLVLPHETAFHYADWHSILTIVKGVVSPGRPSHHLAQVARECGVPLIGHVTGDLTTIPDGATIQINGATGAVLVL